MAGRKMAWVALALAVAAGLLAQALSAIPAQSDQTNVAVPAQNGTSAMTNLTGLAQMYVGFYGNVSIQVRNDTSAGNVLYRRGVSYGKLYFFKAGAVPGNVFLNASTNATVNDKFSLSGAYNLSYNYDRITLEPFCGVNNVSYLNTTDNIRTGLLYDNAGAGTENYFFCTQIGSIASANGFGPINYEAVVVKSPSYMSYDIWFDLT